LTTGLPLPIAAPFLGILLHLAPSSFWRLFVWRVIGTPALSVIGMFGAALTVGLRRGGLLLSLLVLPMYVPTLIFGTELVRRGAEGMAYETPLVMLAGITAGAFALIPFAAAGALRINLK
jgi:heme exporter protein B